MDQKSGIQKQTKRSEKISLRKLGKKKARIMRAVLRAVSRRQSF